MIKFLKEKLGIEPSVQTMIQELDKREEVAVAVAPISNPAYPKVVQEIHAEFFTASDLLLNEAKDVLRKQEAKEVKKGLLLESLGFGATREAKVAKQTVAQKEAAEATQKQIIDYAIKYPAHKFITEEKVKQICAKYNLVFGEVAQYTGFVPQKNAEDIVNFSKKYCKSDVLYLMNIRPYRLSGSDKLPENITIEGGQIDKRNNYYHIYKDGRYAFQSQDGIDFYAGDDYDLFGLKKYGDFRFSIPQSRYMICAPVKDMNTEGYQLKGHKLVKHVPDPVVLSPVVGGFLIVTAWGDEASDPDVLPNNIN